MIEGIETTVKATNGRRRPPGPKGLPMLGIGLTFARDPLGTVERLAREYGDMVELPLGPAKRLLVNHPDLIEQVMVIQQNKFHKSTITKVVTGRLLGQGLLISEGDFWRRQRRLAQPAFQRTRINSYSGTMVECAEARAALWSDGETRDIAHEMMGLTLDIAVRTLFGTRLPGESEKVGDALGFLMRYSIRKARSPISVPESWPTPKNKKAKREIAFLDAMIYGIINERKAEADPSKHNDLLAMLMSAMDEDGSQMTPLQLRDEAMTLFLAGHETTAITLAWMWYLLSENPAAGEKLREELRTVLAGRAPDVSDLVRLPYLLAVVNETLRLYPAAYIVARTSIAPFSLGGYEFPADTTVIMSQWVMHRDGRYFEEPLLFRPERWLDGLEERLPKGVYFPFGGGPRRCIGQNFALMETALAAGTVASRFKFTLVEGARVVPEPLVTLRPKYGIRMRIERVG